jgi:hypothetical protein
VLTGKYALQRLGLNAARDGNRRARHERRTAILAVNQQVTRSVQRQPVGHVAAAPPFVLVERSNPAGKFIA